MTRETDTTGDPLFRRALAMEDEAYLMAERALVESPESVGALTEALEHPDPVARLMADVVLEWRETEDHPFDAALRALDAAERSVAGTVARTPPVRAAIEQLSALSGGRLAELLALRLVKQPEQPSWRVLTTLGYLDRNKTPAVTEALIRFAVQSPHAEIQQMTARVIAGLNDPELPRKLAAARERLVTQGTAMPPALAALGGAASGVA